MFKNLRKYFYPNQFFCNKFFSTTLIIPEINHSRLNQSTFSLVTAASKLESEVKS